MRSVRWRLSHAATPLLAIRKAMHSRPRGNSAPASNSSFYFTMEESAPTRPMLLPGRFPVRPPRFERRENTDRSRMSLLLTFITSLMLGMRHATDPDHIVAVTTIVTRERSVLKAAGIGAVWGLGHTITLLLVGGAIIVF